MQIREAMKRYNVNNGKKLVRRSGEAFNAGKEIEAMKRLTLHSIASSLHRFCCPALTRSSPFCLMEEKEFWLWRERKDQERRAKIAAGENIPQCLKNEEEKLSLT
jgi:hypothetical protein